MKRIISILLALVILISISAVSASAGLVENRTYYYKDFSYHYITSNQIGIDSYSGTASKVTIPSEIDGHKVTRICGAEIDEGGVYGSFSHNKYIEEVIIPDTVTEIGDFSFKNCSNLKRVRFGKNVKVFGMWTFSKCYNLTTINLPETLTDFDSDPFAETNITKIHLTKNIKSADFYFLYIKSVTVSKNNKDFSAKDGVLYNKKKTSLVYFPSHKNIKKFKIPDKVQTIKDGAFTNSAKVKKIILPKNLKLIEEFAFYESTINSFKFTGKKKVELQKYAFWDCKKLKSITIPKNVTKIGKQAFGFYDTYDEKQYKEIEHKMKSFTIKGKKNSAAHKYANKYKFKFVAV